MNEKTCRTSAMTLTLGAALIASGGAVAADTPFGLRSADSERMQIAEAVGGGQEKSISVLEGKCGEGKCGSVRIRQMMDKDGDGRIGRGEYVDWMTRQANAEFEKMAGNEGSTSADKVFESFRRWEAITEKRG